MNSGMVARQIYDDNIYTCRSQLRAFEPQLFQTYNNPRTLDIARIAYRRTVIQYGNPSYDKGSSIRVDHLRELGAFVREIQGASRQDLISDPASNVSIFLKRSYRCGTNLC